MVNAVVCTDLSCKEPYRQVGVGRVIASGSIDSVTVKILLIATEC